MKYAVKEVKYFSGFKLQLTFADGTVKQVDLASHLNGPIFEPLKDVNYFKTVRVNPELDTIVWDNGADMAPEFLDEIGVRVAKSASAKADDSARGTPA